MSSLNVPNLRLDTENLESRRSPGRSRAKSFAATEGTNTAFQKSVLEIQKVLSLILTRLRERPRPPSVFDRFRSDVVSRPTTKVDAVVGNIKQAVRRAGSKDLTSQQLEQDSDDENESSSDYSTAGTLDMMQQLRDLLIMAHGRGWDILSSRDPSNSLGSTSLRASAGKTSPFRRRRSSAAQPRSSERSEGSVGGDLRRTCVSILADIISEDCRYIVRAPRLLSPPHALQAVCLDVALAIIHSQPTPDNVSEVSIAVLPAFSSFDHRLYPRLLGFFESLLRGILPQLPRTFQDSRRLPEEGAASEEIIPSSSIVAIHVDSVQDAPSGSHQTSSLLPRWTTPLTPPRIFSSFTPFQPVELYYLTSMIPPLLLAILEHIDIPEVTTSLGSSLPLLHSIYRLLSLIMNWKPDVYIDLLQLAAYGADTRARHGALILLTSFYPESVGHTLIGQSFPSWNFTAMFSPNVGQPSHQSEETHQFLPWRFCGPSNSRSAEANSAHLRAHPSANTSQHQFSSSAAAAFVCHICTERIHGFGLYCPLCMCAVHLNCYDPPEGSFLAQYAVNGGTSEEAEMQKVVVIRFSRVRPLQFDEGLKSLEEEGRGMVHNGHVFNLVNLFTLTTCFICHYPLWGNASQAFHCLTCQRFAHASCIDDNLSRCSQSAPSFSTITVDWTLLRESFVRHYRETLLTEEQLLRQSYEDISTFQSVLWTQLELLNNGIASGSIIVHQQGISSSEKMDDFELHYCIRLYEAYLSTSGRVSKSPALNDYHLAHSPDAEETIFFDWPLLAYITSLTKSTSTPITAQEPATPTKSNKHLSVQIDPELGLLNNDDTWDHPAEIATVAHMRDALRVELNVQSDEAARHLLTHLHTLGFFRRLDRHAILFASEQSSSPSPESATQAQCMFALPLLLDASVDVETLVAAIESGLSDIDIAVNETALLLLVRRCWPSLWASESGLERLATSVLQWLFTEDDRLILIAREYVAKGKPPPGVRPPSKPYAWPLGSPLRSTTQSSGGDYVASRRALLNCFIVPWMRALHDLDRETYARTLWTCSRTEGLGKLPAVRDIFEDTTRAVTPVVCDAILRYVLKICVAGLMYSCFDNVFVAWLDESSSLSAMIGPISFPSLPRLFNLDADGSRHSIIVDSAIPVGEENGAWRVNPWRVIISPAEEGLLGLQRAMRWLQILTLSGVSVPIQTFSQISAFLRDFQAGFEMYDSLMQCIIANCWLRAYGAQDLFILISEIHQRLEGRILDDLCKGTKLDVIHRFLRLSLASCLLLYGFLRDTVVELGFVLPSEKGTFPSRQRIHERQALAPTHLSVTVDFFGSLRNYCETGHELVATTIAAFLDAVVSDESPLGSEDIDNLVTLNASSLSQCVWTFYAVNLQTIARPRSMFLLRLLMVNCEPLEELILEALSSSTEANLKLAAVNRLLQISIDTSSQAFQQDDRQWRTNMARLLRPYFSALWNETLEEVRLAVEIGCQSLMPLHLKAITRCFDDCLLKAPYAERANLVSFLFQLHPYLPTWQLLTWETIVEAFLEDDFLGNDDQDENTEDDVLANVLSLDDEDRPKKDDVELLRSLLVNLSLHMIGDGVSIDLYTSQKIKHSLVKTLGFEDCQLVPTIGGGIHVRFSRPTIIPPTTYPCVTGLLRALDSQFSIELTPSALGDFTDSTPSKCSIGALFVDVVLDLVTGVDLLALPYSISRSLCECVTIVLLKFDFDNLPIRHLAPRLIDAVRRLTELILSDKPQDIRQLAISASHALLQRWPNLCAKILSRQIFTISTLISQLEYQSEHVLVAQGKAFLETAYLRFTPLGLFKSLFKKELPDGFFPVARLIMKHEASINPEDSLRDAVVRTVLARLFDSREGEDNRSLFLSFGNVSRNFETFVGEVHHDNYSNELLGDVALALTNIARQTAEWPAAIFDVEPFLRIGLCLIEHHKTRSRELVLHLDTLFRASLVRFNITTTVLQKVLEMLDTLPPEVRSELPPDNFLHTVVDILGEELRTKQGRVTSIALDAILETIITMSHKGSTIKSDALLQLAPQALVYLEIPGSSERYQQVHTSISLRAAHLALMASDLTSSILSNRSNLPVRAWSYLALAALNEGEGFVPLVMAQIASFSLSYLMSLQDLDGQAMSAFDWPPDTAGDISSAYAAIKIWLLLAQRGATAESNTDERSVWNEVWPPFERMIIASMAAAETVTPIVTTLWASYVDLIVFLLQSGSFLGLETAVVHISLLERLCQISHHEMSVQKLTRALWYLQNPPQRVSFTVLLERAKGDLVAAEKLVNTFRGLDRPVREATSASGGSRRYGS